MTQEIFEGEELLRALQDTEEDVNITHPSIEADAKLQLDELEDWKRKCYDDLARTKEVLVAHEMNKITLAERANLIALAARFHVMDDSEADSATHQLAQDCLSILCQKDNEHQINQTEMREIILLILSSHIKPLFTATPHPQINLNTGRKLPRQAGGRHGAEDLYDDQVWKTDGRGCWNTIWWCVQHLECDDFEVLWPSLVPPIMTMMDDYDPTFKLRAIRIVVDLIQRVNPKLLERTGIHSLLESSLSVSLTYFHSQETPELLPVSIRCSHSLIEKTTKPESIQRFDKLCKLISDAIIGGAWLYAADRREVMESSVEGLIPLIEALGIGSVRFLRAFIPQLSDNLAVQTMQPRRPRLQILSAQTIGLLIRLCKPRIHAWKDRIMCGLLKGWVHCREDGKLDPENDDVQSALLDLWKQLLEACPSLMENEVQGLIKKHGNLFRGLIGQAQVAS